MFSLKPGGKYVTKYIIDFHSIAAESRWNEEALTDAFFQGLNHNIKDELATKDYPESFKTLKDLATRVDLRLMEMNCERGGRAERAVRPWGESKVAAFKPPLVSMSTLPQTEEPMQLGKSHLTPKERER